MHIVLQAETLLARRCRVYTRSVSYGGSSEENSAEEG